jgi:probable HAF family extracellular repeat protein
LLSILLFAIPAQSAVQYIATDLGALPGTYLSKGVGINNNGQVGGYCLEDYSNHGSAFLWQSGVGMQDIGTLGGQIAYGDDINNAGQIAGSSTRSDGLLHAFLWQSGSGMQDLGTLPGSSTSSAAAINDNGLIVGRSSNSNNIQRSFLWQSGSGMRDLGTLGGTMSLVGDINNAGQVVGGSETVVGNEHAFLWQDGVGMRDLGTLGGSWSRASAVNENGLVVGVAFNSSGKDHAFLWQDGVGMRDLGTLGGSYSQATGIDKNGLVIGYSATTNPNLTQGFLWRSGSGMVDLSTLISPSSGWTELVPLDINDNGQIVGEGRNSAGQYHAFLLTPVPEPSTLAILFTAALGGLFWWRRWR